MAKIKFIETIIAENEEAGAQLLSFMWVMNDGIKIMRYACRYEGRLLPLIKDPGKAEDLYGYLIGVVRY